MSRPSHPEDGVTPLYVLVGLMDVELTGYDGKLCVSISADWLAGSESRELSDTTLPADSKTFTSLDHAIAYGNKLIEMDKRLYPPFNPALAEARDGRLVALLLPPEVQASDKLVRAAALRYGIAVRRLASS